MSRKPVRIGLLIAGLLITAAMAYRAVDDEAFLGRAYHEASANEHAAGQALEALLELRGSLHAYVAPGQALPFWSKRAEQQLDSLREHLMALDAALALRSESAGEALDAVDQLVAAEKRMRQHASRGEALLAGDVAFTEVRDLTNASIKHIQSTRNTLASASNGQIASLRRDQATLAAGAILLWIALALVLATPVKAEPAKDPGAWRDELAQTIKKPIQKDAAPVQPVAPEVLAAPPAPALPAEPSIAVRTLRDVGEICSALSTLADRGALSGTLERAAGVLGASGVIVWIASNDGAAISPVASYGFDEKLVSRLGRVSRDSANLTAMAFRENGARLSAATEATPAALAVPLCSPSGPVGVLSVELQSGVQADESRATIATIFAAQLATLASPVESAPDGVEAADVEPAAPPMRAAV